MGQPPAMPLAARLTGNGNAVTAVLAPGKIGRVFIADALRELGVDVYEVGSLRRSGLDYLGERIATRQARPDLVVSAGPDQQHFAVIAALQAAGVNIPMAVTNNATMCCGEGVCGSCQRETNDNRVLRLCKAQTDFGQFVV
jgi:hypothetical protein